MEKNGACLVVNSESFHTNSPLATVGKMNMKRASFHKSETKRRGVQCSLARSAGSCLTSRGADRGDFAARPSVCSSAVISPTLLRRLLGREEFYSSGKHFLKHMKISTIWGEKHEL